MPPGPLCLRRAPAGPGCPAPGSGASRRAGRAPGQGIPSPTSLLGLLRAPAEPAPARGWPGARRQAPGTAGRAPGWTADGAQPGPAGEPADLPKSTTFLGKDLHNKSTRAVAFYKLFAYIVWWGGKRWRTKGRAGTADGRPTWAPPSSTPTSPKDARATPAARTAPVIGRCDLNACGWRGAHASREATAGRRPLTTETGNAADGKRLAGSDERARREDPTEDGALEPAGS